MGHACFGGDTVRRDSSAGTGADPAMPTSRWAGLTLRSALLSLLMAVTTLGAVALALDAFSTYRETVSELATAKTEGLMTASLLLQQSESLVSSSSMLLLAENQFQRREAMFEIADRVDWIDRLMTELQALRPSAHRFEDIRRNRERLGRNFEDLDELVRQRIDLWIQVRGERAPGNSTLTRLGAVEARLADVLQENRLLSRNLGVAVGYHVAAIRDEVRQTVATLDADIGRHEKLLIAAVVGIVLTVLMLVGFVQFSVVRRLTRMQRTMSLARPSPEDIDVGGRDEIAAMGQAIRRYVQRITTNEQRITRMNEELHFHATRDPLTGLFNRRHFEFAASQWTSNRRARPFCIAMIDLDHFKLVNDTYGHDTGDHVLAQFATLMTRILPGNMLVARYGGEEFAILAPDMAVGETRRWLDTLRAEVERSPLRAGDHEIVVTISIGLAAHTPGSDFNQSLKAADDSLYQAKRAGRNRLSTGPLRTSNREEAT